MVCKQIWWRWIYNAIVNIFKDKSKLNQMSIAALETANKFTIEKMAENFKEYKYN